MDSTLLPTVYAGFPGTFVEYKSSFLDLNKFLVHHPAATYFMRVSGDSMINAGIHDKDIVLVDRALTPSDGDIIVAQLRNSFLIKRLHLKKGGFQLRSENPKYRPIAVGEEDQVEIWGVVTASVKLLR